MAKAAELCPSCGLQLERVFGPAEETRLGRLYLYALEVLRCRSCSYNEVVQKVCTTKELDDLLQEVRSARAKDSDSGSGSPGLSPLPGSLRDPGDRARDRAPSDADDAWGDWGRPGRWRGDY